MNDIAHDLKKGYAFHFPIMFGMCCGYNDTGGALSPRTWRKTVWTTFGNACTGMNEKLGLSAVINSA